VVSLGSAGVFTAFVDLVKAFLARDSTRGLKVTWYESGKLQSAELRGDDLDDATLDRLRSLAELSGPG
jgi:hypothetical protein